MHSEFEVSLAFVGKPFESDVAQSDVVYFI